MVTRSRCQSFSQTAWAPAEPESDPQAPSEVSAVSGHGHTRAHQRWASNGPARYQSARPPAGQAALVATAT